MSNAGSYYLMGKLGYILENKCTSHIDDVQQHSVTQGNIFTLKLVRATHHYLLKLQVQLFL